MKTATDPRHQKRIVLVKEIFSQSFHPQPNLKPETKDILKHQQQIDQLLAKAAPEWPLSKVAKVDLAILRLAVYELVIFKKEPPKVIIDEAVELAKKFGSETSPAFINGVLGTILKKQHKKSNN